MWCRTNKLKMGKRSKVNLWNLRSHIWQVKSFSEKCFRRCVSRRALEEKDNVQRSHLYALDEWTCECPCRALSDPNIFKWILTWFKHKFTQFKHFKFTQSKHCEQQETLSHFLNAVEMEKKLRLLKLTTAIIKWEIFSSFFHRWRMAAVKFAYLDSYALEGRDSLCLSKLPPPHPLPLPFKRSMLRWALSALQYIFANRDPSGEVSK